jgi:hypothetical protein
MTIDDPDGAVGWSGSDAYGQDADLNVKGLTRGLSLSWFQECNHSVKATHPGGCFLC